jgi:hypothetical protein
MLVIEILDYAKALWRHYAVIISGAVVTVLLSAGPGALGGSASPWAWQGALVLTLLAAGFMAWRDERHRNAKSLGPRLDLELVQAQATVRVTQDVTCRLHVTNRGPGPANNVRVTLVAISPNPLQSGYSNAHLPQRLGVRLDTPAALAGLAALPGEDISEGGEAFFPIMQLTESQERESYVLGIRGWRSWGHGEGRLESTRIHDGEEWRLHLRITASNRPHEDMHIVVACANGGIVARPVGLRMLRKTT